MLTLWYGSPTLIKLLCFRLECSGSPRAGHFHLAGVGHRLDALPRPLLRHLLVQDHLDPAVLRSLSDRPVRSRAGQHHRRHPVHDVGRPERRQLAERAVDGSLGQRGVRLSASLRVS